MTTNIIPNNGRILVKLPPQGERVTDAGIVISAIAENNEPVLCEVLAVGKGRVLYDGTTADMPFEPGHQVLVGKYSGTHVTVDGTLCLLVQDEEVLARVAR